MTPLPAAALLALVAAAATPASAATPRLDYTLNCMGCHRADGAGTPPGIPRLAGRVGYYLTVPEGRGYLVQVPGASQSLLNDAELAAVLNWILSEFGGDSVAGGFVPYTAEEVARYRAVRRDDIGALRRRLTSALQAAGEVGREY